MQQPHAYYLRLMGIPIWRLRSAKPAQRATGLNADGASWLFILEEAEQGLQLPLLAAILTAIGQSQETVSFAYYHESMPLPSLPDLRYVVAMGPKIVQHFRAAMPLGVSFIESDTLQNLAENQESKRRLWQQLKLHRT